MKDEKFCKGDVKQQCKTSKSAAEELILERKAAGAVLDSLKTFQKDVRRI